MRHTAFLESRRSFCKMQRHQSGRTVEPDQFLWLQHPDLCSGCQLIRQIPRNYEGRTFNSAFCCFKLWSACLHAFYYCTKHETDLLWLLVMGCLCWLGTVVLCNRCSPNTCPALACAVFTLLPNWWRKRAMSRPPLISFASATASSLCQTCVAWRRSLQRSSMCLKQSQP